MKKKLIVALALMLVLAMSGCMRLDTRIDVSANGTADFSMVQAFSDELMGSIEDSGEEVKTSLSAEEIAEYKAEGFTYSEYKKDGYTGYQLTAKNLQLTDLGDNLQGSAGGSDEFKVTLSGGNYVLDWKVLDDESAAEMKEAKEYFEPYKGYMKVVITLPAASVENNATSVSADGKTLTWDLLSMNSDKLHLVFKNPVQKASGISATIAGKEVVWTDAVPFIENGRTLVPLRAVAEALNLTVTWDSTAREAVFTDGTKTIYFPINQSQARTSTGETVKMDTSAIIRGGRTYAPIRYLAEFFSHTVGWDSATRTVVIN